MQSPVRITRRCWLLAGLGAYGQWCAAWEELLPRLRANHLSVRAPGLHMLSGKPLEHLHNAQSLAFDFQLSLLVNSKSSVLDRALERFIVSYALWEETFSVVHMDMQHQSASHLSVNSAESWCLDNVTLPVARLAPDRDFWLRLEVRAEDPRREPPVIGAPGLNLTSLIEIFSRTSRGQQSNWNREAGPFRLSGLRPARGALSG